MAGEELHLWQQQSDDAPPPPSLAGMRTKTQGGLARPIAALLLTRCFLRERRLTKPPIPHLHPAASYSAARLPESSTARCLRPQDGGFLSPVGLALVMCLVVASRESTGRPGVGKACFLVDVNNASLQKQTVP